MTSGIKKEISDRTSYPDWARMYKNSLASNEYNLNVSSQFPIKTILRDYEYMGDIGLTQGVDFDLDEHNGRFCVTPDFPNGYTPISLHEADGTPVFPYNIGRFLWDPTGGSVNSLAQNITVFAEGVLNQGLKNSLTHSGHCELQFGAEGGHYKIEFSTNLTDGFSTLATNITSSSHHFEFTHLLHILKVVFTV